MIKRLRERRWEPQRQNDYEKMSRWLGSTEGTIHNKQSNYLKRWIVGISSLIRKESHTEISSSAYLGSGLGWSSVDA